MTPGSAAKTIADFLPSRVILGMKVLSFMSDPKNDAVIKARLESLTVEELRWIATSIGVKPDDATVELLEAVRRAFLSHNIHSVADGIQSPGAIEKVMRFVLNK